MLRLSSLRLSFIALSFCFVVGMAVVGIGLAQLTIPTTLSNATIYIKDLFVSTDGSNTPANQKIILDGSAGTVTVKNLANTPVLGVDANGGVIAQTSTAVYNYIANQVSGAITTAISGALNTSGNGSGANTSGDNGRYYNPKGETPNNTGVVDIYFADPTFAGSSGLVRIGMQDPANGGGNYTSNDVNASQLIVRGDIESKSAFKIRANSDHSSKEQVSLSSNKFVAKIYQGVAPYNNALVIDTSVSSGGVPSSYFIINNVAKTKVGINTLTLPSATLDIANTLSANGSTALSLDSKVGNGTSNGSAASISHTRTNNAYDASLNLGTVSSSFVALQKVKISSSGDSYLNGGDVGIGTASPQSTLDVAGTIMADSYLYHSDRRLKDDITALDHPLDALLQINGYNFVWKESGKKDIGVIAQEVEKVFPALVHTDSKGMKSVEYGNLVAPIIEAIKELSHKIEKLFTLYIDQQHTIDTLEARIDRLEALNTNN